MISGGAVRRGRTAAGPARRSETGAGAMSVACCDADAVAGPRAAALPEPYHAARAVLLAGAAAPAASPAVAPPVRSWRPGAPFPEEPGDFVLLDLWTVVGADDRPRALSPAAAGRPARRGGRRARSGFRLTVRPGRGGTQQQRSAGGRGSCAARTGDTVDQAHRCGRQYGMAEFTREREVLPRREAVPEPQAVAHPDRGPGDGHHAAARAAASHRPSRPRRSRPGCRPRCRSGRTPVPERRQGRTRSRCRSRLLPRPGKVSEAAARPLGGTSSRDPHDHPPSLTRVLIRAISRTHS